MGEQEKQDGTIAAESHRQPFSIEIDAAEEYADQADFSAAQWANHHKKLNYKKANQYYLHTFKWGPTDRRHIASRAVLFVRMRSLSKGANRLSDQILITGDAGRNPGEAMGGYWYEKPAYIDSKDHPRPGCTSVLSADKQEVTKTWIIEGLPLQRLNEKGTLSIAIGDDTQVLAMTLTVEGD